jgi:hypothetical protein
VVAVEFGAAPGRLLALDGCVVAVEFGAAPGRLLASKAFV